ncbi:MAG TPA: asparaginase [Candidatus Polarisedimenticolia bacterium]|nr:asparaginase [Candidatus Polarisedimenticolia bacterium]
MPSPTPSRPQRGHRGPPATNAAGDYVPAVEVTRGPIVESVHAAACAVAGPDGALKARLGSVEHPVFLRSSAKPFQAMAVVESGAISRFGLTPPELAVIAGSHSSEPEHLEAVRSILGKIGLDASALQCGTHTPFSRRVAEAYRREGRPFTPLEHNCSGKHAGMLAAALALGAGPASYLDLSHPVQQRVVGLLADITGRMRDRIVTAVDGCGAPTLGVSLAEAARAFARLLAPSALAPRHAEAAMQVSEAMQAHPSLVAGQGMLDTELTAMPGRRLIAKRGAEGVQCAAFIAEGAAHGLAAKIADGDNGRARVALAVEALIQCGAISRSEAAHLSEVSQLSITNNSGREVGMARAAFTLVRT